MGRRQGFFRNGWTGPLSEEGIGGLEGSWVEGRGYQDSSESVEVFALDLSALQRIARWQKRKGPRAVLVKRVQVEVYRFCGLDASGDGRQCPSQRPRA